MVHAAGAGFIDFSAWRSTKKDWVNLGLRLQAYRHTLNSKIGELDAMRHIVTMSMTEQLGQNPDTMQEFAQRGVDKYRATVLPWFKVDSMQNAGDPIDDIVDWYLTFRPDMLEEALRGQPDR